MFHRSRTGKTVNFKRCLISSSLFEASAVGVPFFHRFHLQCNCSILSLPLYMKWSLCWRRCLRCASDALSASPFPCCRRLFRSRWILVGVLQGSFDGKSSPARIPCNVLRLLFCVICKEVARDSPIVNFPGNTKYSMTSLAENQAIYSKKERKKERWGIQFSSCLRPRAVLVLGL